MTSQVWAIELWKKDLVDPGDVPVLTSSLEEAQRWLRTNNSDICDCWYLYARVYPVCVDSLTLLCPDEDVHEWWIWQDGPDGYYNGGYFVPHLGEPLVKGRYTIGLW